METRQILDRLAEAGEVTLACLTDEEMESVHADEGTPFRPVEPPERLRSLSEEARRAALTTALRSLVARGLVSQPTDEEVELASSAGSLRLQALGDLDAILGIRRAPRSVVFVGQASFLAALHGFEDEGMTGFLEERIDSRGMHTFTLRTLDGAVEAMARVADPERRTPSGGPAAGASLREIPDDMARALRELAPGVTRFQGYSTRPTGTRRVEVSILVRPEETAVVSSAFGVAPSPPHVVQVNREGLRQALRAVLSDADTPPGQGAEGGPDTASSIRYRCPVCGYPGLHELPYDPEDDGAPSYEICPSCGYEFGVSDVDRGVSHEDWRRQWIADGMRWASRFSPPPHGWNPHAQLVALERVEATGEDG